MKLVSLLLMLCLSLPVLTFERGRLCWRNEHSAICVTFGDAMGIAGKIEDLL